MTYILRENSLLKKTGLELKEIPSEDAFKDIDILAYYFGSKWCSDSVKFTSVLREFYDTVKANNESFEIVYISSDKTEEEMKKFVLESHGDWFVFYMDESDDESKSYETAWNLRDIFAITGIPSLIVTKKEDEEICTMDGVSDLLTMGKEALSEWKKRNVELELDFDKEIVKPREEGKIISNCCRISQFKVWDPISPAEILSEKRLLKKGDTGFKEVSAANTLENMEIVAFFFSASWCSSCYEFTYDLRKCYQQLQKENKDFEIVFVSSEETEEDMKELMENLHENWLALPCDPVSYENISKTFAVQMLPTLRVINKKGEMVSKFGVRDVQLKGVSAFDAWFSGSPATTAEEERLYWLEMERQNEEEKK